MKIKRWIIRSRRAGTRENGEVVGGSDEVINTPIKNKLNQDRTLLYGEKL